ncbi:hypothetical protein DXG01_006685 [Tephrocybe rancida]|nr:hypothetical protein DXG01_006685 [Tephrocybe rancida]
MEGPVAAEDQNNIVKELKQWAVNNWHRDNSWKDGSHDLNMNVSAVVDWLYPDWVDKVLCNLIGVEELGGNRQREFQQRKRTIRKVQDELSNTEFLQVQAEKAKLGSGGNPPEIQHRLATTQGAAKIKAADAKCLKEMGMVSLTLIGWVKENGKMGIELHDYITELQGIKKPCFSDTYQNLSTKMIDKFMLYLFALCDKRFGLGPLVAVPGDPRMEKTQKLNLDVLLEFDDTPDLGNPGQGDHITNEETEVRLTPRKDPPCTRRSLAEKTNRSKGKENVKLVTALATPAHSVGDNSGADTSVLKSRVLDNSILRRTGTQQSEDTILATQSPAIDVETAHGPPKKKAQPLNNQIVAPSPTRTGINTNCPDWAFKGGLLSATMAKVYLKHHQLGTQI